MKFRVFFVALSCFIAQICASDYDLEEPSDLGSECQQRNGTSGIYQLVTKCEFTRRLLEVGNYKELNRYTRFFNSSWKGAEPIICCPSEEVFNPRLDYDPSAVMNSADDACKAFGDRPLSYQLSSNRQGAKVGEFPAMASIGFTRVGQSKT